MHYTARRLPRTAEEWNKFLLEKYDYGLWPFALSLYHLFYFKGYESLYSRKELPGILKDGRAESYRKPRQNTKRLKNLKSNIFKALAEHLDLFGWRTDEEFIIDLFDVGPFLKRLDSLIAANDKILEDSIRAKPPWDSRGRPVKPIHQVAFLWSEVMRDEKRRRWSEILALLKYFKTGFFYSWAVSDEGIRDLLKEERRWKNISPDSITDRPQFLKAVGIYKDFLEKVLDTTKVDEEKLSQEFISVLKKSEKKAAYGLYLVRLRSLYFPIPSQDVERKKRELEVSEAFKKSLSTQSNNFALLKETPNIN
jgi:hypothetical protein